MSDAELGDDAISLSSRVKHHARRINERDARPAAPADSADQVDPADRQQNEALLQNLRKVFAGIADSTKTIDQAGLQKALEIKNAYFAQKIFAIFDEQLRGHLTEEEFICAAEKLVHGSHDEKLWFAFRLHDADGDGELSRQDLKQYFKASGSENRLNFRSEQVDYLLAELLFNKTRKAEEKFPFQAFKRIIREHPGIDEELTLSAVAWLQPKQMARAKKSLNPGRVFQDFKRYVDNNRTKLAFVLVYIGINVFLFCSAWITYAQAGANLYVQIARGCGACLNFNGALILVPMLRHAVTWLRHSALRHAFPLDQNITFHKLVAHVMFALSVLHTTAHLLNYSTLPVPLSHSLFFTSAGITGVLLLLVFAAMGYFETKRSKNFELFYFSHWAFVLWFALALLHGPVFWQWVLLPVLAYGIERWMRFHNTRRPSTIVQAVLFPSRVSNLQIARPAGFEYRPGDYVFIRIPAISRYEWHPFTISSGPEDRQIFSVHIRNSGNWTNALYEYFLNRKSTPDSTGTPVYLDGPYGAPSSRSMSSKIAVLIGAGIGVTPCASILQSILHQHRNRTGRGGALERVHFFWLNRDQQSFEWFADLLLQLEKQDIEDFLDINIYMTGARADMKSRTLNIAMDLLHRRLKVDLVTGLKARTRMGHPKWEQIFEELAAQYRGQKVDVYFCGPPGLSATLNRLANKVGLHYHKENF